MLVGKESSILRKDQNPALWPGLIIQEGSRAESFRRSVAEFARMQAATSGQIIEAAQRLTGPSGLPFESFDVGRDFRSFSVIGRSSIGISGNEQIVELSNRNPIPVNVLGVNIDTFLSYEYVGGSKSGTKFVYFVDEAGNFAKMRQATDYDHGKREIFEQFGSPMVIVGEAKVDWHEREFDSRLMRMGLGGIDSKLAQIVIPH